MLKFNRTIPVEGYEWRDDLEVNPLINDRIPVGIRGPYLVSKAGRGRVVTPMEFQDPKIFEAFAALAVGSKEGLPARILEFANRYGNLGTMFRLTHPNQETSEVLQGEAFSVWAHEIPQLAMTFRIRRLVQNRNLERLTWTVHLADKAVIATWDEIPNMPKDYNFFKNGRCFMYADLDVDFLPGDVIGMSNYILQKVINDKLMGHVSPWILRDEAFELHGGLMPDSTLAAIWHQMHQDAVGEAEYIECEVCGGLIEKMPGGRSTKRVHTRCAKMRSAQMSKGKG